MYYEVGAFLCIRHTPASISVYFQVPIADFCTAMLLFGFFGLNSALYELPLIQKQKAKQRFLLSTLRGSLGKYFFSKFITDPVQKETDL